ncbi:MAG: hypothetical protein IPN32_27560 [Deltaproteobacteria bacterium]|nr:hypothetical protein [Deltaproteobacteria bacterium]
MTIASRWTLTGLLTSTLCLPACGDDTTSGDTGASSSGGSSADSSAGSTSASTTEGSSSAGSSDGSSGGGSSGGSSGGGSSGESSGGSSGSTGAAGSSSSGGVEGSSSSGGETSGAGCACNAGEYCDWPDDQCGAGQDGVCLPLPNACPDVVDPVCGCDNNTYGNDCEAAAAGVDVAFAGPCEMPACDCQDGEYCDWPDDQCGGGEAGDCVALPDACDDVYDPVCGCDGATYSNECYAALEGVDVAYAGDCAVVATCDCGPGQYCMVGAGMCGAEDGVCTDMPMICGAIYAPVCGCDMQTYSNECEAAANGVNVAYDGDC